MRREGLTDVLTNDEHCMQEGFRILFESLQAWAVHGVSVSLSPFPGASGTSNQWYKIHSALDSPCKEPLSLFL
jgi:hypothetical protein